jgi:hypothetical protein
MVQAVQGNPGIESAAQALAVAGVAGVLLIGGLSVYRHRPPSHAGSSRHLAARVILPMGDTKGRKTVPVESYFLRKTVRAQTASGTAGVAVLGAVNKQNRSHWTVRVHVRYDILGTSQGVEHSTEVPCDPLDDDASLCRAADSTVGN